MAWATQGLGMNTVILRSLEGSKGFALYVTGSPERSVSSGGPRRYAQEIAASVRMKRTTPMRALVALKEVYAQMGVPESHLRGLTLAQALKMLRTKAIPVGGNPRASFEKSALAVNLLGRPEISERLGIRSKPEIVREMNDPDHHGSPAGTVGAAAYLVPGESGPASKYGVRPIPDYRYVHPGAYLGGLPKGVRVRLIQLARPDFERWHAEETPKHEAWKKLDAEALAHIQANLEGKSPEAREAWLQGYARKKGYPGLRQAEPKEHHWLRSIEQGRRLVEIDLGRLKSTLKGEAQPR